ncbi:DegT/DnrJ/EryC1/StrS aminotransferase family protein [Aliarcobacter butzleri]|uniref:DegT/DnrJ/EryC1/StrS aminotransferase family protein n=1 Tax=Aliarcobacter butzleri TaxID=28197 RepID=UPI0021B3A480|nr:DegT/DnrJ/EryC1/StrS family aminotransferase [Aliarcobacter butzleri]MCT7599797.1 DegT/DnrJ/EryC1/StrS family aminotransferase [Aliarcobacter butzleri]
MEFKINFSGTGHKYTQDEIAVVVEAMQNADPLTQGKYRDTFEQKFCEYNGNKYAFSVCNATAALELAAQLCIFKKDDEIVAPSHTFTSSVYPFIKKGAKVVWADIDLDSRVVTLESIKKCVNPKTKAIVVVHLYGFIIPDIQKIADFAKENNILLIEDVAQAMGTSIEGKKAGTFGDFGIFSFHSHKNITTLGEGGMLTVKEKKYADIIPMLRHNGHCGFDYEREHYWQPAMGDLDLPSLDGENLFPNNYCLGEVECALGAKLLDRIDEMNAQKRERAVKFIDALKEFDDLIFHRVEDDRHNYHLLVAYVKNSKRDEIMKKLVYDKKIKCVVQYYPLNRYPFYQKLGFGEANCPNADEFFDNMISFPFQHWMSDEDFLYILEATQEVMMELK